ncbi:hypothetical protein Kpol_1028p67 [Vanderwaltozyma polyspora DSM 70294]|uniref:Pre-mRNA-splicing factor CWC22 n=1 Tax=Vanderwaltozyma polyspora (strain ATCC 22028 / DSM 70294 / BCRC 21397 / CBS 2163 / NBRC 10782 / NRRL Y-8283 / UCD 57-17) TaxID=436907 RepID=A7TG35_VANPO|nr:uncharacterized protein Kpol_1028p67 [Vanderwaltozyma polyspora DSM 70294]EDO18792.1 hypothetical protein Kpol_1028p67 [Vanderwaltozyma polyspora DSM 70294]
MSSSDGTNLEELQRENWSLLKDQIEYIIGNADEMNIMESFKQLFEVNVLVGQRLLVDSILKNQLKKDIPVVYALLVALINSEMPEMGLLMTKESIALFIKGYNNMNNLETFTMATFIAQLFNYEVVHEIVILQILHLLLEDLDNGSLPVVISLLTHCGKKLVQVNKTIHNAIFEKLRHLLQSGRLSRDEHVNLEWLFELRSRNYQNNGIQSTNLKVLEGEMHTFMIDTGELRPDFKLTEFIYDDNYVEKETLFESLKLKVYKDYFEEEKDKAETVIEDRTGITDVEFKKNIYLILKSSLTGDEAAHKLLKLRIPDDSKDEVVNIIIKSSIQESTYSKFYGILTERLLGSHRSWTPAFIETFKSNYENASEFEPAQLRIMGKLWGHILATEVISFEIFLNVHLNEEESTPAGRILLKFLFQELVGELGIDELRNRLEADSSKSYLVNMFPTDDLENIRYSINYFTAIGLGSLTEEMRDKLKSIEDELKQIKVEEEKKRQELVRSKKEEEEKDRRISRYNQKPVSRGPRSRTPPRRSRSRTPPRRNRSRTPPRRARNRSRTPPRRR